MLVITNAEIITGKDDTILRNASIIIKGKIITDIRPGGQNPAFNSKDKIIDASDNIVIPGIINHHAHGVTLAPLFPSGAKPLSNGQILQNLDQHMIEGTTTLLNLDGFAINPEVSRVGRLHPINLRTATSHTPLNLMAAELADGSGLKTSHKKTSVHRRIREGAVAVGEIGSGATLGGMGQDYLYIPEAVKERTGIELTVRQARALKEAVLGKNIDQPSFNPIETARILEETGLSSKLTPEETSELVRKKVLPSFKVALKGLKEGTTFAKKYNVPVVLHNAAASKKTILQVAREFSSSVRIVAAHCNHSSFDVEEALDHARRLKRYGVTIDICSGDFFRARHLFDSLEITLAFFKEKLADVISTDYMGGFHDPILLIIKKAVQEKVVCLPEAIKMATYNVVKSIPRLAPNRGILLPNKIADLVLLNKNDISEVRTVIIDGNITVENGRIRKTAG